jgi:hypothetical protein
MADLENYRQIVKEILTEYYEIKRNQGNKTPEYEVSDRLALDEIRASLSLLPLWLGG